MKNLRVLGVCAGQGTLLFPFKRHLIANIEPRGVFHTPGEEQWKLNFGDIPFYKTELLPDFNEKPDIILSTPDCGSCSAMRLSKVKKIGNPMGNKSLNLVISSILKYEPKFFLIENLPKLLDLIPLSSFQETLKEYKLIVHMGSVSKFGNSQVSRKRLVIVGIKKELASFNPNLFKKMFQVKKPKITRRLLKMEIRQALIPPLNKVLAMYDYRKLPEKKNLTVREIQQLWTNDFRDEKKWPIKTEKMSSLPGVYKLDWNQYPLTLRPADRQFRPDGYPLGIMDFKAIMGFPKRFKVCIDENNYLYWINKARYTLAKGAVYEIGLWFKESLKKDRKASLYIGYTRTDLIAKAIRGVNVS